MDEILTGIILQSYKPGTVIIDMMKKVNLEKTLIALETASTFGASVILPLPRTEAYKSRIVELFGKDRVLIFSKPPSSRKLIFSCIDSFESNKKKALAIPKKLSEDLQRPDLIESNNSHQHISQIDATNKKKRKKKVKNHSHSHNGVLCTHNHEESNSHVTQHHDDLGINQQFHFHNGVSCNNTHEPKFSDNHLHSHNGAPCNHSHEHSHSHHAFHSGEPRNLIDRHSQSGGDEGACSHTHPHSSVDTSCGHHHDDQNFHHLEEQISMLNLTDNPDESKKISTLSAEEFSVIQSRLQSLISSVTTEPELAVEPIINGSLEYVKAILFLCSYGDTLPTKYSVSNENFINLQERLETLNSERDLKHIGFAGYFATKEIIEGILHNISKLSDLSFLNQNIFHSYLALLLCLLSYPLNDTARSDFLSLGGPEILKLPSSNGVPGTGGGLRSPDPKARSICKEIVAQMIQFGSWLRKCDFASCSNRETVQGEFKCCSRCKFNSYCNKEHQVSDWKNHKTYCVEL
ncbi:hypothetical protein HK099_006199 [Clydaea vesicula]|uniref:MYND-type domain-containing protein n=1 Tax=Clydaea vesicula TaxID=447962 RepID=A0AAD5U953_9FUNG|nr:hypothetical protein HK099_006199 [Clydaea vesicula]